MPSSAWNNKGRRGEPAGARACQPVAVRTHCPPSCTVCSERSGVHRRLLPVPTRRSSDLRSWRRWSSRGRHRAGPPWNCPSVHPYAASRLRSTALGRRARRSEAHTSELQSPCNLVCRLLLGTTRGVAASPPARAPASRWPSVPTALRAAPSVRSGRASTGGCSLSLRAALPISAHGADGPRAADTGQGLPGTAHPFTLMPRPGCGQRHSVAGLGDRKRTRLNSSHLVTSYAVFCLEQQGASRRARRRARLPAGGRPYPLPSELHRLFGAVGRPPEAAPCPYAPLFRSPLMAPMVLARPTPGRASLELPIRSPLCRDPAAVNGTRSQGSEIGSAHV